MDRRPRTLTLSLCSAMVLASCGGGADDGAGAQADEGLQVIASFYPLEYLAERVAGEHAEVSTLTAAGVDPHDVELTPRVVGALGTADLVVYESGMQPAVDEAVAQQADDRSFDVTSAADLLPMGSGDHDHDHGDDHNHGDDHESDGDDHAGEGEAHADGHEHGPTDPHFWLDPQRYGDVAEALAEELAGVDPERADDYAANAAALVADLETLDEELRDGLADCASREVVTTHEAFGYLGARYDLHVTGITGISPEAEPSPARLAEVTRLVAGMDVTTVYTEPLLSPAIAETVATETGTQVRTLDPADGLSEAGAGSDYLQIMRANLAALREGQGCS